MERSLRSSKSRGGCQRCKAKRLKCDETHPACKICRAYGVECPGFARPLRWSSKHEVFSTPERRKRQRTLDRASPEPIRQLGDSERSKEADVTADLPGGLSEEESITAPSMPQWPNLEACGYEALAFSTVVPGENCFPDFDTSFAPSFFDTALEDLSQLYGQPDQAFDASVERMEPAADNQRPETPADHSIERPSSANLLHTFYRLSVPAHVPGFSDHDLIYHYFNNVCSLISCYDSSHSSSNPFRALVGNLWSNNATIYFAIQSMAIGLLVNNYPHMASLGLSKRSQAWKSLQRDLQKLRAGKGSTQTSLLSLLLIGLSSSWHQSSNLGLQYLYIARNIMQTQLSTHGSRSYGETLRNNEFYHEAILHWEMLAAWVDPVPIMAFPGLKSPNLPLPERQAPILPHPWTGVAAEVQFALAEIGRILRRQRDVTTMNDPKRQMIKEEYLVWASRLERFLTTIQIPKPDDIVDYDDEKTPKLDLIRVAEAYRYVGLLEIYNAFPQILEDTIDSGSMLDEFALGAFPDFLSLEDSSSWSVAIAMLVIETVKPIAISSGTNKLLPIILVAAAGQLRLPECVEPTDADNNDRHEAIVEARYIVEARMLLLSRKYPQRPLLQMMDIITATWERLDDGSECQNLHWLDVVHEKGWQTIMG